MTALVTRSDMSEASSKRDLVDIEREMDMASEFQPLIDWCNQPGSGHVQDSHLLRFVLTIDQGHGYEGFLYFLPPRAGDRRSLGHFSGGGYAFPNAPQCQGLLGGSVTAHYAEVAISMLANGDIGAGVNFYLGDGRLLGPKVPVWNFEADVRSFHYPPGSTYYSLILAAGDRNHALILDMGSLAN